MDPFRILEAVAAPLPLVNVNTDTILPGRYLKTIHRSGLGAVAFYTLRFDEHGAERPEFVLNQPAYRGAQILIAGANFGCGSSREHAPWALADLGIRCIVAPSFADIFHTNCFKNGMLCVTLPAGEVDRLSALAAAHGATFTVDLERTTITAPDGTAVRFDIDAALRAKLLDGLDDIDATVRRLGLIDAYEKSITKKHPWKDRAIRLS